MSTKLKVYVAGPMRGYPELNYPSFDKASEYLRSLGHEVRSPAENDKAHGVTSENVDSYKDVLPYLFRWDIKAILWADAIALLDGWEHSRGTQLETSIAAVINVPCHSINSDYWERVNYATTY